METLGRYEIRGELGRGGMGVVYRAYDPTLDREVAIKSVRLDGVDEAARAQLEERLSREAKAAAKLQHPNIVAVHDFFRVEDRAYIVMEFVRGSMLDAMIVAGNRQKVSTILKVLKQSASALDLAHKHGIVHRDIKPGNILVDEAGNIKITDFGIARITSAGATETMSQGIGSTVGTLGYMAPEQIRGEPVDGRADQFSLGIVAYQLFSGEMPFQADTWIALSYKIIHEEPPTLAGVHAAVTPGIENALKRAISKQPADRFPSCSDFVDELSGAAPPTTQTRAAVARQSRNLYMAGAAMLVVLLGIYWMYFRPKPAAPVATKDARAGAGIAYAPPVAAPATSTPAETAAAKTEVQPPVIEFAAVPPGRFFMGSDTDDEQQKPRHMVQITKGFEMATTETTEKQWNTVMSAGKGGSEMPKVNVSWNEAQAFIAKLNQRGDGYVYRLPTEAEWEYAARSTGKTERPKNLDEMAWYWDTSGGKLHEAGTLLPNGFGLFDMLGNVNEWTLDWYEEGYYAVAPPVNPTGAASGKLKINRGGAYDTQGMMMSAAWRFADEPGGKLEKLGFRVVRVKR